MWQLFVEPNDVLLFRDGKPFSAGEDHRAKSIFPPTPFTVQGMIRAKVLFDSGISPADYANQAPSASSLIQQIGKPGADYGRLRIRGPFVVKRREDGTLVRYFPLPADVVEMDGKPVLLKPLPKHPFRSNAPLGSLLWHRTDKPLKEEREWLNEENWRRYLNGEEFSITEESELLVREPRLGIALNYSRRSTQEGMLYQAEFLRLREGVGFLVQVDGIPRFNPGKGFLQLGGEARAVRYEVLEQLLPPLPIPDPLPSRFKVILLTPAWFSEGWQPRNGDWKPFFSGDVQLVAGALRRAQAIGGAFVDDRRRQQNFQKVMRRFVPAGSVFFFESKGQARWNKKSFTETPPREGNFGQIGFGCVTITGWDGA
jgi:CRISPR-associated protein Cmr3